VSDTVTLVVDRATAEDLVADESTIKVKTMVDLEYAALRALGMDE
jgi:hypothetical protein